MSSKKSVNLLPKDQFEYSAFGKLIQWAANVGRWIVVVTEFIVICAFISRFYFDTKLANLFDEISQKKKIVASTADFEKNFRQIQDKMKIIKTILAEEKKPSLAVIEISQLLPPDVFLTQVSIEGRRVSVTGISLSERGLRVFVSGLANHERFTQVNLANISTRKSDLAGIEFNLDAYFQDPKPSQK